MSKLRPELNGPYHGEPCPTNGTAYLLIYNAVKSKQVLIHGHLHERGESCAIGSYFDLHPKTALNATLIDEVALVNDSAPTFSGAKRRQMMLRWLRWKLSQVGMPGFENAVKP